MFFTLCVLNLNAQVENVKNLTHTDFTISKEVAWFFSENGKGCKVTDCMVKLENQSFGSAGNLCSLVIKLDNKVIYSKMISDVRIGYFNTNEYIAYSVFNDYFDYWALLYSKEDKIWSINVENKIR